MKHRLLSHSVGRLLRCCVLAAAAILPLWSAGPVDAHALFERATPVPDSILSVSPGQVHIWFSEDLSSASSILVWNRFRQNETRGTATVVPGQSKQLEVALKPLPPGSYLVLWTSVSADDGHILHGSYIFSVIRRGPLPSLAGVSLSSGQQTFPDTPTLVSLITHWLEVLFAVVWVGSVAFEVMVLRQVASHLEECVLEAERRRRSVLITSSLVLLPLSSSILILVQAYGLAGNDWSAVLQGSTWSAVFSATYGRLWIGRQVLALLALLIVVSSRDRRATDAGKGDRTKSAGSLLVGLVYLYLFAASGHAASAEVGAVAGVHLLSISVVVDWLHVVADALWFGGQVYLAATLIPALQFRRNLRPLDAFLDALNGFSPLAYLSVALFIVSGAFAGKVHIPSWYAFFQSVYGRVLIIKMILIALMMLTSTLTVYVLRPAIRRTLARSSSSVDPHLASRVQRLLLWLRVNPVLGAGVLFATSVMFYYPVPFGFGPPPPSHYITSAAGLTGTVTITPNRAGVNQISITLRNRTGAPVTRVGVRVLTTMLDMPMGTGVGLLEPTGAAGTFTGKAELGMGGDWRLEFLIYLPDGNFVRLTTSIRVST